MVSIPLRVAKAQPRDENSYTRMGAGCIFALLPLPEGAGTNGQTASPPRPTLNRRAMQTAGAAVLAPRRTHLPDQPRVSGGFVHSARAFTSARAWRALVHAHAAEPASRQRGFVRSAWAFTSARTPPVGRDGWQSAARPMRRCGC